MRSTKPKARGSEATENASAKPEGAKRRVAPQVKPEEALSDSQSLCRKKEDDYSMLCKLYRQQHIIYVTRNITILLNVLVSMSMLVLVAGFF